MESIMFCIIRKREQNSRLFFFKKSEEAKRHRISGMIYCTRIVSVILIC